MKPNNFAYYFLATLVAALTAIGSAFFLWDTSKPIAQIKQEYTNPFIITEDKAADELSRYGIKFTYRLTGDGFTNEGGSSWYQEYYTPDNIMVTESYSDYKSSEKAKAVFEESVKKWNNPEVYERIEATQKRSERFIAVRKGKKPLAIIIGLGETSVYEVYSQTLRYAFAFEKSKQKKSQ